MHARGIPAVVREPRAADDFRPRATLEQDFRTVALGELRRLTVILLSAGGSLLNLNKKGLMKGIYEFKTKELIRSPFSPKFKSDSNTVTGRY